MNQTCKDFTKGIYKALNNVVMQLKRPDVQSVEALCIRLTGDVNAGRMLYRLLYWWPKSVKRTGEVYKSWRDWDAELCLTRDQVTRVHSNGFLEAVGVQRRQRQTVKGNPIHYLLNVDKFLTVLAEFVGVALDTLLAWLDSKRETEKPDSPCTDNPESPCDEPQQVTDNTSFLTELETENDLSNTRRDNNSTVLFSIPDLPTKILLELLQKHGLEKVKAMYEYAKESGARNVPGWVRRGLDEGWVIDTPDDDNPFSGMTWNDFADDNFEEWRKSRQNSGVYAD
jgi:hypothetical protein